MRRKRRAFCQIYRNAGKSTSRKILLNFTPLNFLLVFFCFVYLMSITGGSTFDSRLSRVTGGNLLQKQFSEMTKMIARTDGRYSSLVRELEEFTRNKINNESTWKDFSSVIADFVEHLNDPHYPVRVYQIELTKEIILPYLNSLKGRIHTDPVRHSQMTDIMTAILGCRTDSHPAYCLLSLETVLKDVKSRSYFFQSELATVLERGVTKQWLPIIEENRVFLRNIGGKFVFLGLLGVVGWPVILLSPLLSHSKKLLTILKEFDHSGRISSQSVYQLGSILVMLLVCLQLTSIMSQYMTLGFVACGVGGGCLFIAQNDRLIKQFSPTISDVYPSINRLMSVVDNGDFSGVGDLLSGSNQNQQQQEQFPQSDRVEEISSNVAERHAREVDNTANVDNGGGVRNRKKNS
jgi:hypothetical protein